MFRPTLQVVMSAPGERGGRGARSSGVSERPRAGSRYGTDAEAVSRDSRWWRDFGAVPGGRKLWCRLVTAFTFVSLFGIGFIFLGAAFVQQAYQIYRDSGLSLPLTWCVIGIVCGSLMVLGSIVLGRFLISDKWRKNQQPSYPSMAPRPPATVRYVSNGNHGDTEAEVHIDLPPPYEASDLPPVFIVTGRNVAVTLQAPPAPGVLMPPSYTETLGSPPKYAEIDDVDRQQQGDHEAGNEDASSSVVMARQLANNSSSRIEVITVVSTREDPPPYDEGLAGVHSGSVPPLRVMRHDRDGQDTQVEPPVDVPPSQHEPSS